MNITRHRRGRSSGRRGVRPSLAARRRARRSCGRPTIIARPAAAGAHPVSSGPLAAGRAASDPRESATRPVVAARKQVGPRAAGRAVDDRKAVGAPKVTGAQASVPSPNYLAGYPAEVIANARSLLAEGRAAAYLRERYPETHGVRTDAALYDYAVEMKNRFMRKSEPLAKVGFDNRLHVIQNALGTHTTVSRVQGGKLKAKREIRIAGVFRDAPTEFLKMIVVHELAHLKERDHDKAFYALCMHMTRDYHQLEFDLRLWLMQRELAGSHPV
jgi:predicted metal-dependent hydrolase